MQQNLEWCVCFYAIAGDMTKFPVVSVVGSAGVQGFLFMREGVSYGGSLPLAMVVQEPWDVITTMPNAPHDGVGVVLYFWHGSAMVAWLTFIFKGGVSVALGWAGHVVFHQYDKLALLYKEAFLCNLGKQFEEHVYK